jgi:hypothetical protein
MADMDINKATIVLRTALEECPPEFDRVSIANDLIYWADCHGCTGDEKRALIRSACDEALEMLDALEQFAREAAH